LLKSENTRLTAALALFVAAFVLYAACLGNRPFATRGEGREALVVSAMVDQHNFILPRRNGEVIPSKPPLFHWLALGAAQIVGGPSEFSIRFPSALCAALALSLFFFLVAQANDLRTAGFATAIMATTFEWSRSAANARVDMCFSFFLMLSAFALYRFFLLWQEQGKISLRLWLLVVIAGACSVLSKGPAGLLLPWTIAAIYLLLVNRASLTGLIKKFPYISSVLAVAGSCLIAGSWYWLAYRQGGQEFLDVQLLKENFARVVEVEGEELGHNKPFYFGLIHLMLGFLPWSLFFPLLAAWLWRKGRELFENQLILFSLVWVAVFLVVVSVAVSKRTVYFLPAYPAVAYLLACCLIDVYRPESSFLSWKRFTSGLLRTVGGLLGLAYAGVVFLHFALEPTDELLPYAAKKSMQDVFVFFNLCHRQPLFLVFAFFGIVLYLLSIRSLRKGLIDRMVVLAGSSILLIVLLINVYVLPTYSLIDSPHDFMTRVSKAVSKNEQLFQYKHDFYAAVYYARRNAPFVGSVEALPKDKGNVYLLVQESELAEIEAYDPAAKVVLRSKTRAANGKEKLTLVKLG
jgi:4-amino-4-deoxy-L-arabinose transferase-like glycosyltransferase